MKLFALISWYNEHPAWLAAATSSLRGHMGVDHVVALDGAYALYPQGKPRSPTGQAEAIRESAAVAGMGCTIHEPQRVWAGNEVEKRAANVRIAESLSEPEDWYFVLDGDEIVTSVGRDVKLKCRETPLDCGRVTLWQYREHYAPDERPFVSDFREQQLVSMMFRAIPGLTVRDRHYHYITPDGRHLAGDGQQGLEQPEDFSFVEVEHRNAARDLWRSKQAKEYYKRREELGVEGLLENPSSSCLHH